MLFKDTKYLFSKYQLSIITDALTDNLELPAVLHSVSKRIIAIDDELDSLVKSGSAYYDDGNILSPNFAILDGITDKDDRSKTVTTLYHIVDLKREKRKLANAISILTELFNKVEIK